MSIFSKFINSDKFGRNTAGIDTKAFDDFMKGKFDKTPGARETRHEIDQMGRKNVRKFIEDGPDQEVVNRDREFWEKYLSKQQSSIADEDLVYAMRDAMVAYERCQSALADLYKDDLRRREQADREAQIERLSEERNTLLKQVPRNLRSKVGTIVNGRDGVVEASIKGQYYYFRGGRQLDGSESFNYQYYGTDYTE